MSFAYSYINSDPIIEFFVKDAKDKWNRFLAYVDSGAGITVLTRDDANRLGLILEKGERIELFGVGGVVPAYIHKTKIRINDIVLEAEIAFSTSNETPRLLGRRGLFNRFVVCFDDSKKKVVFSSNSQEPYLTK